MVTLVVTVTLVLGCVETKVAVLDVDGVGKTEGAVFVERAGLELRRGDVAGGTDSDVRENQIGFHVVSLFAERAVGVSRMGPLETAYSGLTRILGPNTHNLGAASVLSGGIPCLMLTVTGCSWSITQ